MKPHRVPWFTVRGRLNKPRHEAETILYDGPDRELAEAAQRSAVQSRLYGATVSLQQSYEYAPPERNRLCQCKHAPMRQMLCLFGHMTECHYPLTCEQAACRHFSQYGQTADSPALADADATERMASWLAQAVRPGDRVFRDSPDSGDPACLCSRCGALIAEQTIPVRMFDAKAGTERRYHPECLGLAPAEDFADMQDDDGFEDLPEWGV